MSWYSQQSVSTIHWHCLTHSHKHTLTSTVHKLMWAKNSGKISKVIYQLQNFLKSSNHGSTPLNKLSIGIHANIVLRNRHSTPHVTIFWKFWWHKLLKQRLNFNLSLLWWCRSRILFEIQASEQRHRLFSLAWSPLHHIRPGRNSCAYVLCRFEFKISVFIWIMTKLYSLNFIINNHHH